MFTKTLKVFLWIGLTASGINGKIFCTTQSEDNERMECYQANSSNINLELHSYCQDREQVIIDAKNITILDARSLYNCHYNMAKFQMTNGGLEQIFSNTFFKFKNLIDLDLSRNKIQIIPLQLFSKNSILQVLNLSYNKIRNLQFGVFNDLDNLELLDLSYNQLTSNALHTVYGLKSLRQFYFNNNEIDHFDFDDFPISLEEVSFYRNKLKFTCKELLKIILKYRKIKNINYGSDYDVENVHGIACNNGKESNEEILTTNADSSTKGNYEGLKVDRKNSELLLGKPMKDIKSPLLIKDMLLISKLDEQISTISILLILMLITLFGIFLILFLKKYDFCKIFASRKSSHYSIDDQKSENLISSPALELVDCKS